MAELLRRYFLYTNGKTGIQVFTKNTEAQNSRNEWIKKLECQRNEADGMHSL